MSLKLARKYSSYGDVGVKFEISINNIRFEESVGKRCFFVRISKRNTKKFKPFMNEGFQEVVFKNGEMEKFFDLKISNPIVMINEKFSIRLIPSYEKSNLSIGTRNRAFVIIIKDQG